jgi:hypothetical protein
MRDGESRLSGQFAAALKLEGSHSTNATRADQVAYARGIITVAELRDRVRRRRNVQ